MDLKTKRSIVPQEAGRSVFRKRSAGGMLLAATVAFLTSGCVSVHMASSKPLEPHNLQQAQEYLDKRDSMLDSLNRELNAKERDCYDRFLVSDCVDAVRSKKAEYRRAHIVAETTANDLIRLDKLNKDQKSQGVSPSR